MFNRVINNVLIENNVIDAYSKVKQLAVESVNGLWLKNNTIKCDKSLNPTHTPVIVSNSRIEEIDGVYIDYASDIQSAVAITGCEVDEANIRNIEFVSPNTGNKYTIN